MLSAVIAKMQITGCRDFGKSGFLTTLNCVCENDLMAAYAGAEENRCFTKYSPWGEGQVGAALGSGNLDMFNGRQVYMVSVRGAERPKCKDALLVVRARVHGITNHGDGQAQMVEVVQCGANEPGLRWKMAIDNPPAVEFFVPGQTDYWVAFYAAEQHNRDTALIDALADATAA
jgi:hypothetical protein